jgi:pimeloyl-ACP methyl ester carboxylesterase
MNDRTEGDSRSLVLQAGTSFDELITVEAGRTTTGEPLSFPVVAFGTGSTPLVIVPGLSDGLTTVEGRGRMMAYYYRKLPDEYRVYVISRPKDLPEHNTTREMAADYAALFETIGFEPGSINLWGVSQGGMISQWIAIDNAHLLNRLCLTVTTPEANETLRGVVGRWMALARAGEHGTLMRDTMRRTYTPRYLRRYWLIMPFLGLIGRPKSFRRFLIQADSCMNHNATESLNSIRTPTLVVGGGSDDIVGRGTSERLAELVPAAELELYPELGHGAFEEAGDCTDRIMRFFGEIRDTT